MHDSASDNLTYGSSERKDRPAYVQVCGATFLVFEELEGRWSQVDPFTYATIEEAERSIRRLRRYKPWPSFTFHVVQRTTIETAVT